MGKKRELLDWLAYAGSTEIGLSPEQVERVVQAIELHWNVYRPAQLPSVMRHRSIEMIRRRNGGS